MEFLKEIAQVVKDQNAKSVALQLPDHMLADAALFCSELERVLAADVLLYVLGDT